MTTVVKIKKGLDINLIGKAPEKFIDIKPSGVYAIVPDHFVGITPKAVVRAGDFVKAGEPLMIDKGRPEIKFVSPVSGEVTGINRGDRRKILSITVKPDEHIGYAKFYVKDLVSYDMESLKALLLDTGMWVFFKQRPYDRIANPSDTPRDIFVTAYDSAPLAPDFGIIIKGEEDIFKTGLNVLARLTHGKVYLGVKGGSSLCDKILPGRLIADNIALDDSHPADHSERSNLPYADNMEVVELYGPHPAGNVGVMINHVKPVNKGETVWTLNAADVLIIGRLFKTGTADFSRVIALTGSGLSQRGYASIIAGCTVGSLVQGKLSADAKRLRFISGNVLTGSKVSTDDFLGAYHNQVTVIPEGDDINEFLGWAMPGLGKYSVSRTYFTWLFGKNKEYDLDARIRGGKRAMIMSNEYDKVFPMDILPEYLLKAIIAFDIDKMENLGIYEVAPEDFALCEFVDTSKIEIQQLVRDGLDLLYKEMS